MQSNKFASFSWIVLAYNIFVILFGAFVRATGSGAGCGSHWPLCNGVVIPKNVQIETIIEFSHRLTSGAALLLVVILFIWAFRLYPKGSNVRLGASLSLFFIITEALVGAGLVLFEWVAQDTSVGRAISIVIHLINTFVLLAVLTLTAHWASGGAPLQLRGAGINLWLLLIGLAGTLLMGASGALAALGDTLFPVNSLAEGIQQEFSTTAHYLVRLRLLHPSIAVLVGLYLIAAAGLIRVKAESQRVKTYSRWLTIFVLVQLAAGLVNVLLLAPVWMQIVHLFLADLVWIFLILFSSEVLAKVEAPGSIPVRVPSSGGLIPDS
jgi:heme A synthase